MLKIGTKAPKAIKELQANLNAVGYLTVIDGEYGPDTAKAVKAFQAANSLKADGVYGSITDATLDLAVEALIGPDKVVPVSHSETPWMDFMLRNLGQHEVRGPKANPFIVDLFKYTGLKGMKIALSDETAWCAACVCAALEKNGYKSTHSATAASYDRYGSKSELVYGAIVTIKTKTGSHRHVTFFEKFADKAKTKIVCIGGNQSDMVKRSTFAVSKVASVRWPVKDETVEVPKPS